jgi:GNAT superfamily N-acetyltransferase
MHCTTLTGPSTMHSRSAQREIAIRAVRRDDGERIVRAFKGLDPQSIYRRFFFHKRELSAEDLRALTESDGRCVVVLVATTGSGADEAIVAMGQYARRGECAQIAFAVEEDFQGRGIATRLLRRLVQIGREHGVCRFEADVLAENSPMLAVFRRSGLPIVQHVDGDIVHLTLFLGPQTEAAGISNRAGET